MFVLMGVYNVSVVLDQVGLSTFSPWMQDQYCMLLCISVRVVVLFAMKNGFIVGFMDTL